MGFQDRGVHGLMFRLVISELTGRLVLAAAPGRLSRTDDSPGQCLQSPCDPGGTQVWPPNTPPLCVHDEMGRVVPTERSRSRFVNSLRSVCQFAALLVWTVQVGASRGSTAVSQGGQGAMDTHSATRRQ